METLCDTARPAVFKDLIAHEGKLRGQEPVRTQRQWKQGDVRADGKVFKQYQKRKRADGSEYLYESWMTRKKWVAYKRDMAEHSRRYYEKNRKTILERQKRYHRNNRDAILEKQREYTKKNKASTKVRQKRHYEEHKLEILEKGKKYAKQNRQLVRKRKRQYVRRRRANDPLFVLVGRIRCRVNTALTRVRGNKDSGTEELLGCSFEQLQAHIEAQFTEGMNWDEGRQTWHLDHIAPLAAFDLKNPTELRVACNYRNLRPLPVSQNMRKGGKMPTAAELKPLRPLLRELSPHHPVRMMATGSACGTAPLMP